MNGGGGGDGGCKRPLGVFLEEEVLPRLFERLDQAFPEFGWEATQDGWVATNRETTKRVLDARPERVICNRPFGFYAHGGQALTWLAYVNGGRAPRGQAFLESARRLCELAGVPFPEREVSAEELRAVQAAEARRAALEAVTAIVQRLYASEAAAAARAYVRERGLDDAQAAEMGLGFYPSVADVRYALAPELHPVAREAGLLWERLEGYVLFPWLDDWGRPLTLYGRWPGKAPPERRPKAVALPGSGTKRSPLYFDRARAAGERDLVLVEGVLDAAVLQARGETRVVACVGAQLARAQVETLVRHKVASVTICLDPDRAGERGALACVRALGEAGIAAYVAPRLPDGLDPDELVLRDGLDAWRAHLGRAQAGARWRAERALEGVTPASSALERDRAVREVGEVVAALRGSSAERERDELLRLLAKATGSRVGALRAELPAPVGVATEEGAGQEKGRPEVTVWPYREEERGLVWIKERFGQDGSVEFEEVPLANFTARITGEVREDDGAEERRFFEITGRVGKRSRSFQIASSQFNGLAWAVEELGVVNPTRGDPRAGGPG
ncbi:MAG: toprim domain-containing protein [Planctomycetes bacterium]|nr:toprim domain-containing protein [Planctomycetota bacterium]